jgi:hypothetical protein
MKQIGMVTSSRMSDYRVIASGPVEDDRNGSLRRIAEADPLIPEDLTATTTGGLRTRNL